MIRVSLDLMTIIKTVLCPTQTVSRYDYWE